MSTIKDELIKKIEEMSDAEAKSILKFADQIIRYRNSSETLRNMSRNPSFTMPDKIPGKFRKVKPAKGKGIPASELLIKDRK
jgi:hypothetical protein